MLCWISTGQKPRYSISNFELHTFLSPVQKKKVKNDKFQIYIKPVKTVLAVID